MHSLRLLIPSALVCVICWAAADAHAGRFLHHKQHLTTAQKVAYFKRSLRHERQVVAWLESRFAPRTLERHTELRWYRAAVSWHTRLLAQYKWKLKPPPRIYAGPCLAAIIDYEGSGWDPQRWNGGGSGAYGLPQALPATKMRSAGPDWATNAYTQIDWMRVYVVARYGSCEAALAHWTAHRSY